MMEIPAFSAIFRGVLAILQPGHEHSPQSWKEFLHKRLLLEPLQPNCPHFWQVCFLRLDGLSVVGLRAFRFRDDEPLF